jgi:Kyakuja-Dileera-Zisupton transposase
MKGAGNIDGEIMETLWSGMNKVSGSARSMSKAHRQETLDDYMRDSNWKKTVGIGRFLFPQPVSDYLGRTL